MRRLLGRRPRSRWCGAASASAAGPKRPWAPHANAPSRPQLLLASAAFAHARGPALWAGLDVSRRNVYCEVRLTQPAMSEPAACSLRAEAAAALRQEVRWDQGVRQPVNTLSNLPFALTGAHMLALGVADARAARRRGARGAAEHSELERYALFSLLNGGAQLWVAAGSLLFHGSWTRAGQRADMGAVYTVLLCPAAYVAQRLGLFGPGAAHRRFAAAVLAAAAWFTVNKWRIKSSGVVPSLIVVLLTLQALWFYVGSPPTHGVDARRWLWGPVQRRRPAGMAWPLLCASALSIAVAFGARARGFCFCTWLSADAARAQRAPRAT
jgi:hypothetical protein